MILDNVYTFQRLQGMGLYGNDHENTITWDVTSSLSGRNTRFGGKPYFHLQGRKQHFHNVLPKALCVTRYEKNHTNTQLKLLTFWHQSFTFKF